MSSVFLIGVCLAALAAAGWAHAFPDVCEADVEIAIEEIGAEVSSTAGTTVGASGVVTFQRPPGTQAVVNLTASTDNGWPTSVWPESTVVVSDDKAYFWVSVEVPRAAAAGPAGNVIVDARIYVESFPCTVPAPDSVAVRVRPYVDVFGARIPVESRHASPSGSTESFDIEVDVMSNAPMLVTFDYTSAGGVWAQGPAELLIEPTFTSVSTKSITVTISGDKLRPGTSVVDIHVVGRLETDRPLQGHLGYTMLVPEGAGAAAQLYPAVVQVAAAVAAVGIAVIGWHRRGARRRREATANLRKVMAERAGLETKGRK